ncbi:hypothetical protein BH10CYA1_BH10CYA1_20020 [soil metagenome]
MYAQGDEFAGYEPHVALEDLDRYLHAEPRDFGARDPFASWLCKGPDSSQFVVGQAPSTYVTKRSSNDPWAEFFVGKGPRPIKLTPDDILPRAPVPEFEPDYDSDSILGLDAFVAGATTAGIKSFSSGSDSFSMGGQQGWLRGDRFSSRYRRPGRALAMKPFRAAQGAIGHAEVLPEPRWPDSNSPLRVYISGTVAAARGGLVSYEIKTALSEWRQASNGKLRYVLTDQYVSADIVFVCENTTDHQWAENVTEYHNSKYDRVRICLIEETLLKLDPKRVRGLCLHEVGHAFGIRNHSNDKRDAMSLAATDESHPVLGLSNNDRKLIAKLYP